MKQSVFPALALAAAFFVSGAPAKAETVLLQGDALREAISGKVVHIATPIGALPIQYAENGTMSGYGPAEMVIFGGESVQSDRGKWWIEGARLCQRWQNWLERQTYCYEMRKQGNAVRWTRNDGKTGTARISQKIYKAAASEYNRPQ